MSEATYKASILAASRGVYTGNFDVLSGAEAIFSAIRRGFEQAWREGAKECGVLPDERTEAETVVLNGLIGDNNQYVGNYIQFVFENRKTTETSFEKIKARAQLWVNRYQEVKAKAQSMACTDKKLQWVIDGGEHCRTCLKLNGRVARASAWAARDIYPRMVNGKLKCGGYNCKCTFRETDQPVTRGRWPNLP